MHFYIFHVCVQFSPLDILRPTVKEGGELTRCTSGECEGDRVGVFMCKYCWLVLNVLDH